MSRSLFRAPKGTRDVLAPESTRQHRIINCFGELSEHSGFELIESPIFEDVTVFQRIGVSTEIVTKELFEFNDKGTPPQRLALRPELTAGVCRAFVQHRPTVPWKVWYHGPQFRYERPQSGRYRQFVQVGAETLGTDDPHADVEMIRLGLSFYETLGLSEVRLLLNSLGDKGSSATYRDSLARYLKERAAELTDQSRATLKVNPLRVLDSKRPKDQPVIADAPMMIDFLSREAADHFREVRACLDGLDVTYEIAPRLVRGLDYYTRTIFEFVADSLGSAQNAVGGGGRYDGLVESLGGPPTPGIGLALGVDRTLMACDSEGVFTKPASSVQVFVVDTDGGSQAVVLCDRLRRAGVGADRAFDKRSMKAQMKVADRSGARIAVIVGPDERAEGVVSVRDLRSDTRQRKIPVTDLVSTITEMLIT